MMNPVHISNNLKRPSPKEGADTSTPTQSRDEMYTLPLYAKVVSLETTEE